MRERYTLEKNLYFETLWFIRRYPQMLVEYNAAVSKSPVMDGQPHGSGISDPTANLAAAREKIRAEFEPIEKALAKIPAEYRKGILDKIIYRKPFPIYADTSTWKRWKRRFIYFVAQERRGNGD